MEKFVFVFLGLFGGAMASKEGGLADLSGLVSGTFKVSFYNLHQHDTDCV